MRWRWMDVCIDTDLSLALDTDECVELGAPNMAKSIKKMRPDMSWNISIMKVDRLMRHSNRLGQCFGSRPSHINGAVNRSTNECAKNFIISLSARTKCERNFHVIIVSMETFSSIQLVNILAVGASMVCVQETLSAVVRKQIYMKINNHNIFHLTFEDCRTLNGRVTNQKRRISFRLQVVYASSGAALQANAKIMRKLDLAFFLFASNLRLKWSLH